MLLQLVKLGERSQLKAGKIDSSFELSSDHFLHAGDDLFCHIALLLSAMIVHG